MIEIKLSSKRKMRNMLFICFLILICLARKNWLYSICTRRRVKRISIYATNIRQDNKP